MKRHILAITVLLLSLTPQLSAQRTDEESLQGLRDIGLVVKYGQVNGQPAEWQSTILQKLEDRAKQRLEEAGARIDLTGGSGILGRPRVVFTINLNRVNSTAAPVQVEASLHQRVRLWRGSAKEFEVATWTLSGIGGPEVTEKMLTDVFDGLVKRFLEVYVAMNPASSQAPTEKISATSAQLSDSQQAFEGLNSTGLSVSIREDFYSNARQVVLQQFLREAAEKRLQEAGIKLIRYTNEAEKAGHAHLAVWVKFSQPNGHAWAPPIGVESRFSQWVRLTRNPKKHTSAVTWESHDQGDFVNNSNGELVIADDVVLELVNKQVDEFINVLKGANANVTSVVPQAKSDPPRQ
ncbi:MAG TPA: hypothetical protein VKB02_00600 [Pyrinomonadaceae bacterium]|nr:hypothetical protein [Pyrinomonadaceae bacterium]